MSRLEGISKPFRDALLAKGIYVNNKPYEMSHTRAISDGDEHGKGDGGSGQVGSKTDIVTKTKLLAKNKYSNGKPYNLSNA